MRRRRFGFWLTTIYVFYTGLTRGQFETLFRFLEPDVYKMKMWKNESKATTHDLKFQLKLVLLCPRRGYNLTDISFQFKMSRSIISNLFITWIQLLYKRFGELRSDMFAPQSQHEPVPPAFKNKLLRSTNTDFPAYSDTLGTWEKCHCNQIVTVTRGSLLTNQSFGTCHKCRCKQYTVNSISDW